MNASDYVYFNLHKKVFSIKLRGKVREHTDWAIVLPNAEKVEFVVSEAGRQRVLNEQRKNVHAYVRGLAYAECAERPHEKQALNAMHGDPIFVSYNPYKGPTFYNKKTGEPIRIADAVLIEPGPTIMAWGASS
jgi:hypothetical protein